MFEKRHGLTLNGKILEVKPCLPVFSIIRLGYPECNIQRWFFGQDGLLWRCSSEHPEVSELPISPSSPLRPHAEGLQDASCWQSQGRTGCEYPAALLQRLRFNQATAPCICRAEKALHKIAGTLCKWNVQHKDVRITQMCSDGPYVPGIPRIAFEALNGKVSEKGGWVFVNNDEAYGAVKVVSGGYYWIDSIKRLLYLNDVYSPIIIQTGRAADYGTFEEFQAAILAAPLTYKDYRLVYHGPKSAEIEFIAMTPERLKAGTAYTLPKVNGKTIDLNPKYAYYSPYMQRKEGSDIVTLSYGDRGWVYDFENNTVTEKN